jgi:hypothetical protein
MGGSPEILVSQFPNDNTQPWLYSGVVHAAHGGGGGFGGRDLMPSDDAQQEMLAVLSNKSHAFKVTQTGHHNTTRTMAQ